MRILKLLGAAIAFVAAQQDFEVIVDGQGKAGSPFVITAQKPSESGNVTEGTKPAPSDRAVQAALAKLPKLDRWSQLVDAEGFVRSSLTPAMGDLDGIYESMRVKIADASSGKLANFWDFERTNEFNWVPQDDGTYEITVTGRRVDGTEETLESKTVTVQPSEGISSSTHNLVLHYGTPPCAEGSGVSARFRRIGSQDAWTPVPARACRGEGGNNFYLAGLYANTAYEAQHQVDNGEWSASSRGTTGEVEIDAPFPYVNIKDMSGSETAEGIIVHHHLFTSHPGAVQGGTIATDMDGETVWYFKDSWNDVKHKPMFMFYTPTFSKNDKWATAHGEPSLEEPNNPFQVQMQRTLRVYDLAGNTINRCTVEEVNKQLEERGNHHIYQFHHDSIIKEDGNFLSIIANEILYDDFPGFEGKKVVVHIDGFIELTPECEVKFMWSWLDHIDPRDSPPKQDTRCDVSAPVASSCGTGFLANQTVTEEDPNGIWIDWSHANAIQYIPEDGSVILDSRNQNNVLKINYARGHGDGKIIWDLGKDGDFEVIPAIEGEQHPWFSAQHSPRLYNNKDLIIFDNSNQRVVSGLDGPQTGSNSRGQVFVLDEENMIANQTMSAELDGFSYYLGSAQRLANGETWFLSGFILPDLGLSDDAMGVELMFDAMKNSGGLSSHSYSIKDDTPEGEMTYMMDNKGVFSYRSYKMHNMYEQETPLDFHTCCIDSDCGAGRTCSCECEGVKNADGMDDRGDDRDNRQDDRKEGRQHRLRHLLFGASGTPAEDAKVGPSVDTSQKCGCVGFL